jgi:uncharacterized protein (TIGR03437 family)
MKFSRLFLLMIAAAAAQAQTWDTSGNSMLNGTYYFRQVIYVIGDEYGDLERAISLYGNISFNGSGSYTITSAQVADSNNETLVPLTTTGTYSIAASGYGLMSSPYVTGDYIYGLVSNQGIFVGSSTETQNVYNDMMIAAPLASPAPTAASFTGSWICADFDLSSGSPATALSLKFPLSPNGAGSVGNVTVTGYYGDGGATPLAPQVNTGLKYTFSSGAAVVSFPTNGEYVAGSKYLYFSPDGNFLFGGSPNSWDMIVGVKTTTSSPTVSGLYYQAGFDEVYDGEYGELDSYYGSEDIISGTLLGHQRVNSLGNNSEDGSLYDYTYNNAVTLSGNTMSNSVEYLVAGDGGAVQIISGVGPYMGISVGLQAPSPTGSGVYINPIGVVNAASFAPFTAAIAPGEFLNLYGSGLASGTTTVPAAPFPTTGVGGVTVTIGGYAAAIDLVSPGVIQALVPYEVTPGSAVQIQVTNNGALSNVVWAYVDDTAPGVFTVPPDGVGYGAILDAVTYTQITPSNPATIGETLAVYMTGLGEVSPAVADGAAGPSSTLSNATNTFSVDFGGVAASAPGYAGMAPGLVGNQLNVTVPTGLTAGLNYLDIAGPDTYMSYPLVDITTTANTAVENAEAKATPTAAEPRAKPKLGKGKTIKAIRRVPGGGK